MNMENRSDYTEATLISSNMSQTPEPFVTTINHTSNTNTSTTQQEVPPAGRMLSLLDYTEYNLSVDMYPVHTFLFVIAGMLGNTLVLCVILRKNMRAISSSVFVATLAVADNIALIGFLIGMIASVYANHIISDSLCMIYFYFLATGSMISAWTVVVMTFERVLIVTFPLKAPNWTSRKKAVIAEAIIIVSLVLHNIYFFFTVFQNQLNGVCEYNYAVHGDFLSAWSIYDACISSYVPLILILLMNITIIVQIKRAQSIQKSMSNAPASNQGGEKQVKSGGNPGNATNQITIMLLSVSIAFFICMSPYGIFQIYLSYIVDFQKLTLKEYARFALANQFCTLLWETNHSINIVLYSLTGRKFRNEMLALFTCGRYEARPRSATYASDTTRTTNMRATNGATSMTSVNTVSAEM